MEKSKINIELIEIQEGVSFGANSGAIIETYRDAVEPDALDRVSVNGARWAWWGTDNDYPQRIIDENSQESVSAGALRFKIAAHYGAGLQYHKKIVEKNSLIIEPILFEKLPTELQDFHFINDLENFQQRLATEFEWHNRFLVQYLPNKLQNKILEVNGYRTKDYRKEKRNRITGKIDSYFLSSIWPDPLAGEYTQLKPFDKRNPFMQPNAVHEHSLVSVDKDYYTTPLWQANTRWVALARKIPRWINANIDNAMNIKYHIRIPQSYFEALHPRDRYINKSDAEWMEAMRTEETNLKAKIDLLLTGSDNAQKTFYSKIALDVNGDPLPGWEIIELKNEIKDTAWLNTYGTAGAAICSAHGVPPSLAGLILGTGLGSGSGSDVREQFNYYMQLNTVIPRQTSLEPWNWVKRFNKWPADIHLGYENIILQSLDQNKSGYAKQNESSPTSAAA
jgi:ribosomal protein S17E